MHQGSFVQRLALGTAQFGLAYGINNDQGQPTPAVVQTILAEAATAGINLLDTAAAYGDSELRLGSALAEHPHPFALITKIAAGSPVEVNIQLTASLNRLRQSQVFGVLFHNFEALQKQPIAYAALIEAKAAGKIQHIGVSLYHPWQAEWLLNQQWPIDILQVPFNVLDQRFGPWLPELAKRGIEVYVRSAFLQGLLLRNPSTLPAFFSPLKPKIATLRQLAATAQVPLAASLLLFAAYTPGVARVVIGVDSVANLRENLAAGQYVHASHQLQDSFQSLAEKEDTFILPYTWPPR
jgi:aryl-alcohol dehydrogenase-like predicted oxidoreductase